MLAPSTHVTTQSLRACTLLVLSATLFLPAHALDDDATDSVPDSAAGSDATGHEPMTLEGLNRFVAEADPDYEREGNVWQFTLSERRMLLIADPAADRMRLIAPIARADDLPEGLPYRMLQANFDTTLDARYAIANDVIWSAYVHPLSPLDPARLSDAALQVWTAAATFGTTFTSGSFHFGGGDSNEEIENQRRELKERLEPSA